MAELGSSDEALFIGETVEAVESFEDLDARERVISNLRRALELAGVHIIKERSRQSLTGKE